MKNTIFASLVYLLATGTSYAKQSFIVDTDVGVDDVVAILYLLQHPQIQIQAITIASTGNAHCQPALDNTLGLLQMMKQPYIPVACGQEQPLNGHHHFPDKVLEESDTLAGTAQLLPHSQPNTKVNAVDLMIKTIQDTSEPVTILAIGPLTNIAQALQKAPQIKKKIRAIYIMGGAIETVGNIKAIDPKSKNLSAEWNIYIDPLAAQIVLSQNIPVVLVPLDITNQMPINMSFYNAIKKHHDSPAAKFVFALLTNNIKMIHAHYWYFWDPLAAVIASDNSVAQFKTQYIRVILSPEIQSGGTVIDPRQKHKVYVVTHVDKKRFKSMLIHYLNKLV